MNRTRVEQVKQQGMRPSHPGAILREMVLPELGMTQSEFAARLGVSRRTINEVLQEKRPVSPDLAHRLGRLLGNGPDLWLNLQINLYLWDALHGNSSDLSGIVPVDARSTLTHVP